MKRRGRIGAREPWEAAFLRGLGARIRAARIRKGWTQGHLADESGVDLARIGYMERGQQNRGDQARNPSLLTVARLARALGVEPSVLLPKIVSRARK